MDAVLTGPSCQDQRPRLQTSGSWGFIGRQGCQPRALTAGSCAVVASAQGLRFPSRGGRGTSPGLMRREGNGGEKEMEEDMLRGLLSLHCSFLPRFKNGFPVSKLKPASCNQLDDLNRDWGVLGCI